MTALRVADGSRVWHAPAAPCPDGAPAGCSPAQPGAVTLIPGAVFATSNDGHVRAHATSDGRVLWDFDTLREFETVNGVPARGLEVAIHGRSIGGAAASGIRRNPQRDSGRARTRLGRFRPILSSTDMRKEPR